MNILKTKSKVILRQAIGAMRSREVVGLLSMLHNFLDSKDTGPFLFLQGERGIGKSSLLKYLRDDEEKSNNFERVLLIPFGQLEQYSSFVNLEHKANFLNLIDKPEKSDLVEKLKYKRSLFLFDDIDLVSLDKVQTLAKDIKWLSSQSGFNSKFIFTCSHYPQKWKRGYLSIPTSYQSLSIKILKLKKQFLNMMQIKPLLKRWFQY